MGIFDKIKSIEKINEAELKNIGECNSSWHDQYKDSSYIYIGNLDNRLTEGDIAIVFSQFGEPIDINLVRDEETGKSKGYCFLSYADQRSTILAVDNFNGYKILDRPLVVDHVLNYRLPKKYSGSDDKNEYKPTGAEGKGIGVYNVVESEISLSKTFEKIDKKYGEGKRKKLLDEDELWALNFEKSLKNKHRNIKNENIKNEGLQSNNIKKEKDEQYEVAKNENYGYKERESPDNYIKKNKNLYIKNLQKHIYNDKDTDKKHKKDPESKEKYKKYYKEKEPDKNKVKRENKKSTHKSIDKVKNRKKYKSKDRYKSRSKGRNKSRSKDRSKRRSKDRNKSRSKDRSKRRSKDRRKYRK